MVGVDNKLRQYLNKASIRRKFFVILIIGAILPTLLIQLLNYALTTRTTRAYVSNLESNSLEQIYRELTLKLNAYESVLDDMVQTPQITDGVSQIRVWNPAYQLSERSIRSALKEQIDSTTEITGAAIIADNRDYAFYDKLTRSALQSQSFDFPKLLEETLIKTARTKPGQAVFEYAGTQNHARGRLWIARAIIDPQDLYREEIGSAVLCVDSSSLETVLNASLANKPDPDRETLLLLDAAGQIIAATNPLYRGEYIITEATGQESMESVFLQALETWKIQAGFASSARVQLQSNQQASFYLAAISPRQTWLTAIYRQGLWILIAGIGIILLASSLIFYTSKLTTLAADEIIMAMDQANWGDLSVRIVLDRTDEFGRIALSFNQMISRMQALINQVRQAERLKREAEISALEAQINPHFLYNTLDAINWVAIDRNQPIISKMLKIWLLSSGIVSAKVILKCHWVRRLHICAGIFTCSRLAVTTALFV
ncbi:histidine kinase [Oscillospiraceae bacterium HV4-5-C5C]|nr:histidine kinase [Oscillospiraceae bacterium HV4-5-C5C]